MSEEVCPRCGYMHPCEWGDTSERLSPISEEGSSPSTGGRVNGGCPRCGFMWDRLTGSPVKSHEPQGRFFVSVRRVLANSATVIAGPYETKSEAEKHVSEDYDKFCRERPEAEREFTDPGVSPESSSRWGLPFYPVTTFHMWWEYEDEEKAENVNSK